MRDYYGSGEKNLSDFVDTDLVGYVSLTFHNSRIHIIYCRLLQVSFVAHEFTTLFKKPRHGRTERSITKKNNNNIMAEETTTESITTEVAALSIPEDGAAEEAPPATSTSTASASTPTSGTKVQQDEALTLTEEDEGERGELESDVRSKDAKISGLDKLRMEKEQELESLQKEFDAEQLLQMKESILHRIEVERLKRQTKAVEERLTVLEKDMQNKDAIREYAELIKSVAPKGGNVDSQYVMKLQSQLAKAVKRMDATSHQMTQLEHSCEEVVNSLKKEIGDIVQDRCRTELELKKQLQLLEEQKKEIQSEYDDRILHNQQELERLKEKVTVEVTLDDLEQKLEETEEKLMKLNNTHEMHERIIEELKNIAGDESDASDAEETKD